MNKNKSPHRLDTRRGISTVVGALFFTVLMIAGFTALALALDAQTDIVNTQRMISETELKKQQERFSIGATTDDSNTLGVFVNNHGQNPVEITSIWVINKTLSDQPAQRFTIPPDAAYVPSGTGSEILSSMPLTMIPDTYDIKVVSTYGTIEEDEIVVNNGFGGSSNILRSQLFTIPPDVIAGQNVTIAMLVTNTGGFPLESVFPAADPPYTNKPSSLIASEMTSSASVDLKPLETVLFKWNAEVSGSLGTKMDFSTYAKGIEPDSGQIYKSSNSTDSITFQIDGGDDGTLIALSKDLLNRPEIFSLIPSPQGYSSTDQSLWGINVVNPINSTMQINKVVIAAFPPGAQNNDQIFDNGGGGCNPQNISPPGTNSWKCPTENTLMWQNRENPIILPPFSTQSFIATVDVGALSGTIPRDSIIVQPSVFTTLGSFGKADYQTTMYNTADSIVNVYLSDVVDSRNNADINSDKVGISPGSVETFNVVLADMDNDPDTKIKPNAKLIINVPREWDDVAILPSSSGFSLPPTINEFGDGSTQIVAETTSYVGDNVNNAVTLSFSAQAPTVSNDQMYVMYVLADGETDHGASSFSIGPLAEILLHVDVP